MAPAHSVGGTIPCTYHTAPLYLHHLEVCRYRILATPPGLASSSPSCENAQEKERFSHFWKHCIRCPRILLWSKTLAAGFCPAYMAVANAIAKGPQSLVQLLSLYITVTDSDDIAPGLQKIG